MSIKMIAAVGENNELGKNNDLIWHFYKDMQFFRKMTIDKTVIMGSKTFESLPKELDRRVSIVLTSKNLEKYYDVIVYHKMEDILKAYLYSKDEVFIIGGAKLYEQFLPWCDTIYLTEIKASDPDAEVFFPEFNKNEWHRKIIDKQEEKAIKFEHVRYVRKKVKNER